MINKNTILICCLIGLIFTNKINGQSEKFNHNKLASELDIIANSLEKSLAISRNDLPVYNVVKDFGAINDGKKITTEQLQNAINNASKKEPLRLFFPKGIYLTGTLVLKSGVHIELAEGAKILGSTDAKDYLVVKPEYKNNTDRQVDKSLFYAEKVEDISITGKGIIDFQGTSPVYLGTGNNDPRRPFGIRIVSSKNIYISGVMLWNSPQWMQHYLNCENLMIENINVFNHAHQNNDGMDIDGCRNVYVRNCRVDSDDDAICLKSNGPSICENVLIENCIAASHCNALKLGTETTGGFKNIMYRNCKVVQSVTGFHHENGTETTRTAITLIITDGGVMENVWFDNIEATDCITPVFVTLGNRSRKHTASAPKPDVGSIKNIMLSNIKATGAGPMSSSITGLNKTNKIKNVILENINIELTKSGNYNDRNINMTSLLENKKSGYPSPNTFGNMSSYGFMFKYVDGIEIRDINLDLECQDPREAIIFEDCDNVVKLI